MTRSLPTITLTAAFAGGSHDLGAYIRDATGFSITRGSTSPSLTGLIADQGEFNVVLSNLDRRFDPSLTTGPYYPDVVPGVPITVVANWASTDHTIFTGVASGWPQTFPSIGVDQTVNLRASDGVRALSRAQVRGPFAAGRTGTRMADVLAATNYSGGSAFDDGTTKIPSLQDSETKSSAWSLMGDAASAEWGSLFVAADGTVTFLDRNGIAFNDPTAATSQATFIAPPNGTDGKLVDVVFNYDDTRIVNDATLSWNEFGDIAHAEDLTSQGEPWGLQSWAQSFVVSRGPLARSYVQWVIFRYKNPTSRVEKLVIKPQNDPTHLWPIVLSLDVGARITVKVTPHSGGAQIVEDCYIRGIEHDYADGLWTTTYTLDDADWTSVLIRYDDGSTYDDSDAVYSF